MSHAWAFVVRLPAAALILLVRAYQLLVSPLLGPTCRFYPSCSSYSVGALKTHGAVVGTYLTVRRLLRCHPWNPGGVDLVPTREELRHGRDRAGHDHGHDAHHVSTATRATTAHPAP